MHARLLDTTRPIPFTKYEASPSMADYPLTLTCAPFQAFLSREMQYSCPIWGDDEGGPHGDLDGRAKRGDLEAAQKRKIAHVLAKARLRPGDRLLEIGSGWGSVAIAVSGGARVASRRSDWVPRPHAWGARSTP